MAYGGGSATPRPADLGVAQPPCGLWGGSATPKGQTAKTKKNYFCLGGGQSRTTRISHGGGSATPKSQTLKKKFEG
jgi:hypothetical protein